MANLDITVKTNVRSVVKRVKKFQGVDLPMAVGFAMNDTARKMMKLYNMNTSKSFDKPVRFTETAFGFTKTSSSQKKVDDKIAYVGVKGEPHIKGGSDTAGTNRRVKYMRLQTDGGERTPNKKYIVAPAKHSKLNQYGNFPRTFTKTKKANKQKYFFGTPRGGEQGERFNGIWERYGTQKNKKIRMVAKFTPRQTFNKLFPFDSLTKRFIPKILNKDLQKQIRFQFNKKFKSKLVKVR